MMCTLSTLGNPQIAKHNFESKPFATIVVLLDPGVAELEIADLHLEEVVPSFYARA